jgi:hypothetical protein
MKNLLVVLLFFCIASVIAQSDKNVEKQIFRINALTPGVTYEVGIGNNSTLNFDLNLAFEINGGSGRSTEFGLFPSLRGEFRNYNNFNRRLSKGKNIANNSGNYVSFYTNLQSIKPVIGALDISFDERTYFSTGILYGFQRTYKKGFYWNLSFGPGVFFTKQEIPIPGSTVQNYFTDFGLVVQGKIGWVLGKRK